MSVCVFMAGDGTGHYGPRQAISALAACSRRACNGPTLAQKPAPPAANLLSRQIGKRLVEWRSLRGWSQSEAADLLGITRDRLSKYERGTRDLPPYVMVKLDLLGCDLRLLITGKEPGAARSAFAQVP